MLFAALLIEGCDDAEVSNPISVPFPSPQLGSDAYGALTGYGAQNLDSFLYLFYPKMKDAPFRNRSELFSAYSRCEYFYWNHLS